MNLTPLSVSSIHGRDEHVIFIFVLLVSARVLHEILDHGHKDYTDYRKDCAQSARVILQALNRQELKNSHECEESIG